MHLNRSLLKMTAWCWGVGQEQELSRFLFFFFFFSKNRFLITSFSVAVWVIFMFLSFPLCPLFPLGKKNELLANTYEFSWSRKPPQMPFPPKPFMARQPFYLQLKSVTHSWYFSKRFVRACFCLTFPALVTLRQHYCTEAAGWLSHLEEKIITAAEGRR